MDNKNLQQMSGIINRITHLAAQSQVLYQVGHLQRDLEQASEPALRRKLSKLLDGDVSKLDNELQELVRAWLKQSAPPAPPKTPARVERTSSGATSARQSKAFLVRKELADLSGPFTVSDLSERCPGVSRIWVRRVLGRLKQEGVVRPLSRGSGAQWVKCAEAGAASGGTRDPVLLNVRQTH